MSFKSFRVSFAEDSESDPEKYRPRSPSRSRSSKTSNRSVVEQDIRKIRKRLGSYSIKIKLVYWIEPILVVVLIGFWVTMMLSSGTFSVESDFDSEDEDHKSIELILDNQRVTSYKKKRKADSFFYMVTVFTALGTVLGNLALFLDKKNKMSACLLWLFIHFWWMLISLIQVLRGFVNLLILHQLPHKVQHEDIWTQARNETYFVVIFYTVFFAVDIAFSQIVRYRFLFLRKEAKSAQHVAGKRYILNLKKRKTLRLRQKEMYYERERRRSERFSNQ